MLTYLRQYILKSVLSSRNKLLKLVRALTIYSEQTLSVDVIVIAKMILVEQLLKIQTTEKMQTKFVLEEEANH